MKTPYETYRVAGEAGDVNGYWCVPKGRVKLNIVASNQGGWEHVSVTVQTKHRCPTWGEMQFVKELFWSNNETVVQFHPKKSEYVNNHKYCLHLWKPTNKRYRLPPRSMVGF